MQLLILAFALYIFIKTPKCLYKFSEWVNDIFTMDNKDFKNKYNYSNNDVNNNED